MIWRVNCMGNRKVRPVSFNLLDPFEKELNDFANAKGVFSKYVKRLIQKDKEVAKRQVIEIIQDEPKKKKGIAKSFV
jgi:hypothetical protein